MMFFELFLPAFDLTFGKSALQRASSEDFPLGFLRDRLYRLPENSYRTKGGGMMTSPKRQ
jgi:hypothetical protein